MRTITVTIGRNIGETPMEQDSWNGFISTTRKAVEGVTPEFWTQAPYKGAWDGLSEDSFVFYGPLSDDVDDSRLARLRANLATVATYYGQAAIGLSIGESELVESFGVLDRDAIPA